MKILNIGSDYQLTHSVQYTVFIHGTKFVLVLLILKCALCSIYRINNKQTDLKGQHTFILFYFVHMWRTLPPL